MTNQSTKYRKFLAGAATASLVASAVVPTALAAGFSDVPATDTHYENITKATELGLFKGKGDGTFGPYENITRGQVAKVLANYVVKQEGLTYATYIEKHNLTDTVAPFNDVPSTYADSELFNASLIVKSSGIFTGSNNNLMPAKDIVRQQMAKVLVNGFDLVDLPGDLSKVTDNNTALAEFVPQINILSENGVTVTEAFRPTENVVRGQMASFLNRAYEIANPEVVAPGVVSVSAITKTNVKVTIAALEAAEAAFTVEVKDDKGNIVEVNPVALEKGETEATLTFKTPFGVDPVGVWTVGGVQFDNDAVKNFSDIVTAASNLNEVTTLAALKKAGLTNVKDENITAYVSAINLSTTKEDLADIQAIVVKANDTSVTATEAAAAVKAVNDATTQVQLLAALQHKAFSRVNADWIVTYDGAIATANTTVAGIQTLIDNTNTTAINTANR